MQTPVIKVARKGYDINTVDPRNLVIDSTKNQFKVHMEGEGTVSLAAGGGGSGYQKISVDINHNLGYQPSYLCYIKTPDGKVRNSPFIGTGDTGPTKLSSGVDRITDNTLRLYFYIWDPFIDPYDAFTVDYKYIIFVDPNKNAWTT